MIKDVGAAIRQLIAFVTGLPGADVRPGDQVAPTGGQGKEHCRVTIISARDVGTGASSLETEGDFPDDETTEYHDADKRVVASVNFYGAPFKDSAGVQKYNTRGFDRAALLEQQLTLNANVDKMNELNLAFVSASPPRNLAAVVDKTFESRGQVDLTFDIISRVSAPIETVVEVPLTTKYQAPGGAITTQTTEVTA